MILKGKSIKVYHRFLRLNKELKILHKIDQVQLINDIVSF